MFTVRARISNAESLRYVLDRVAVEVKRLHADLPNTLETTRRKLDLAERRVANFVACIGDGKGTRALGQALEASETELEQLRGELAALEGTARATFAPPPIEWIAERMRPLGELLGRQTARSALVLRRPGAGAPAAGPAAGRKAVLPGRNRPRGPRPPRRRVAGSRNLGGRFELVPEVDALATNSNRRPAADELSPPLR